VTLTLIFSSVALAVSFLAGGYSLFVGRQSGATASLLARHRYGHTQRDGDPDPGAARSARAGGRPPAPTYGPPTSALSAEEVRRAQDAETAERARLPRPGEIGRGR
jgi:hypothetical protein